MTTRRPWRTTPLRTSKRSPAAKALAAFEALPETIRVGAYDIEIVEMTGRMAAANEALGMFTATLLVIHLDGEMASPALLVDTLVHEIGHAIFWVNALTAGDSEERLVRTLATAWTQVYRDNPWLLSWIAEALA